MLTVKHNQREKVRQPSKKKKKKALLKQSAKVNLSFLGGKEKF